MFQVDPLKKKRLSGTSKSTKNFCHIVSVDELANLSYGKHSKREKKKSYSKISIGKHLI